MAEERTRVRGSTGKARAASGKHMPWIADKLRDWRPEERARYDLADERGDFQDVCELSGRPNAAQEAKQLQDSPILHDGDDAVVRQGRLDGGRRHSGAPYGQGPASRRVLLTARIMTPVRASQHAWRTHSRAKWLVRGLLQSNEKQSADSDCVFDRFKYRSAAEHVVFCLTMFSSAAMVHAPVLSAGRCRSRQSRRSAVTVAAKPEPPKINSRGYVAEDNSGRCAVGFMAVSARVWVSVFAISPSC